MASERPTLADLVAACDRFKHLAPIVTEARLQNQDQMAVLVEHVERAEAPPSLFGIPVTVDASVPNGVLRMVNSDGSFTDLAIG